MGNPCIFCHEIENADPNIYLVGDGFITKWDPAPVSKGHSLIIPVRHVTTLDEITAEEMMQLRQMLTAAKNHITEQYHPDGFNYGVNEGKAAGQSIPHLHIHVIPRYKGDVPNPRGGVRNLLGAYIPPANPAGYESIK